MKNKKNGRKSSNNGSKVLYRNNAFLLDEFYFGESANKLDPYSECMLVLLVAFSF